MKTTSLSSRATAPEPSGIGGSVGQYREDAPPPGLQAHFQSIWTSVLPDSHAGDIAIVPDGCVDLIWRAGRLWVAGPDVVAARPDLPPGARVLGARFQPGAARHWLGIPLSKIVGQAVELTDLQGVRARDFVSRMEEAESIARQTEVFQNQLMAMPQTTGKPDKKASAIFRFAALRSNDEGSVTASMRESLGVSERSLLRHCRDHFGYGPKTLERILRFQHFMSTARELRDAGLAALAIDAGYADQSHLAREVKALCGMTASALLNHVRCPLGVPG
ncbi:AraC-like DNA-binding protein [Variovorax boronicumulans]|uniref:AraC-like DNA-binding protein n=1 Tax=Variovorax boronicumulans TaxID=436515 RepID=A0AAW8CMM8_9BURK|nr:MULTISPECIES: helix-turn-helix domain-containing protein [Variovorax]MDP9891610.1 AraC-like DNA-binding protein [Variovorax boronicumulans]MDQ0052783.1 AraC-like DNA-binding protein [Variovorax boronicumulans]MDQ0607502.1 AraC-like DNA-binding protein [Variovorax sp. W1I1]